MKRGDIMKDFIWAALPFIIAGLCLAVILANGDHKQNNYLTEGMCIGMCLGLGLSSVLSIDMGLSLSLGMLIGETVGLLIKKEE